MNKRQDQKGPRKYNSTISIFKVDDWTRRAFMQRAGLFLTLMGVPWLQKMETLEKISKKIFGNSLAFADTQGLSLLLTLGFRNGYHMRGNFAFPFDKNAGTNAKANYH